MPSSPTAHANDATAAINRNLFKARAEESDCLQRIAAVEADLALEGNKFKAIGDQKQGQCQQFHRSHQSILLQQRIADLAELRSTLINERARRRREIDEMLQRKEAIEAALDVLREKAAQ